ncbi:MAG: translation initiation factor IF-2 [Omnitrophica bacterium RBG_13_46_9]|nr:MAG: translation initiation factor IF-2 [Omnitrophica bacterium RBG_13_46_9]
MSIRIHQLAKEFDMTSKDLIARLNKLGVKVKGHMSVVDDETAEIMRHEIKEPPKKEEKKHEAHKVRDEAKKEKKPETKTEIKEEKKHEAHKVSDEAKKEKKPETKTEIKEEKKPSKVLEVELPVTVKQLAMKLNTKPNELIKDLMKKNVFASLNQSLADNVVIEIARKYDYEIKRPPTMEEELLKEHKEAEHHGEKKGLIVRAPIVTLMGHVDHGKTSLLDYIRKTKITAKEKGGITQHIGAYEVDIPDKGQVTFLDTPGHHAFTAMRARGANATDIVVLVVAADDGIMPQTVEAIDHAKAANAPIVVAVNKCDLPNISLDKVKKQLSELELTPEEWGGKTIVVSVSAKTGEGVDRLLEMLLLEAEILELKGNPNLRGRGVVIEGKLSPGQGPVATVLVKNGTLRVGEVVLSGLHYGRVKAMINDKGKRITEAPPSTPAEILGLSGVPEAGDEFFVVKDEKKARTLSQLKQAEDRLLRLKGLQRMTLEELYKGIKEGLIKELKVLIKGDVQGSIEALKKSLDELPTKEVKLNVIHMGVGNINESDVMLALVSNAIIIGFNVKVEQKAEEISKKEMVEIKVYDIIYEAIADVRAALEGLLEPVIKEVFLGRAQVRQIFRVSKVGTIAGCYVVKGAIPRSGNVKLVRNKEVIYKGRIKSLKHLKDDVKEAREGFECGLSLEGHDNVKAGDIIESFAIEKITRRLEG